MNPIKSRHIVIGLMVAFILFLTYKIGDEDYSYNNLGAYNQRPIQSHSSNPIKDSEQAYPSTSTWSHNPLSTNRHEFLQTKVKGYREETYWGEQHPIDEKVRDMSDYEFDRYIDEVEENDADVYWGATY